MNFRTAIVKLLLTACLAVSVTRAQYPQGLGSSTVDAVTAGSDWFAVDNEGPGGRGRVLRSVDNGETFSVLYEAPVASDEFDTLASDGSVLIVSGTDGVMHRADLSVAPPVWTVTDPGFAQDIRDLATSGGTWIGVGDAIVRSTDAGATWANVSPTAMGAFNAVTYSAGRWIAVGGIFEGEAFYSTNDGLDWTSADFSNGPPMTLKDVAADGFGNILAVGENGAAWLSVDNGTSFEAVAGFLFSENLNAVVSTGENHWWIGGDQQTLIELENGAVKVTLQDEFGPDIQGLWLTPDGEVLLSGVETVPPPAIDAEAESSDPVEVTLTAEEAEDVLYYSVDGSDPRDPDTRQTYSGPFMVTGSVTLQAVAVRGGVYSPVASQSIDAGEDLVPFSIESISVSGSTVTLVQDVSTSGYTYGLEYTQDLSATPQDWQAEAAANQAGSGDPLTWEITPVPASPRFWRVVILEAVP